MKKLNSRWKRYKQWLKVKRYVNQEAPLFKEPVNTPYIYVKEVVLATTLLSVEKLPEQKQSLFQVTSLARFDTALDYTILQTPPTGFGVPSQPLFKVAIGWVPPCPPLMLIPTLTEIIKQKNISNHG
jgi:hypothetical protein